MKKENLIPGKTYLRKHKATMHSRYGSKEAEAEGYIECMQVTPAGAVFFQSGNLLKLTDEEIEREVREDQWCFGFPCQDISVAGKQLGFQGNRSSLFFRVMYLIGQLEEEDKPTYLFVENVKNLLSVNGGWDFARLLIEMEQGGVRCRMASAQL